MNPLTRVGVEEPSFQYLDEVGLSRTLSDDVCLDTGCNQIIFTADLGT